MKNLNRELYSNQLYREFADKEHLSRTEEYVLAKYLKDTTKRVVEAGTGGGRIIFAVERMGFRDLEAFDFVPRLIAHAETRATTKDSHVKFRVADAADLDSYQDGAFDYLIYLSQVMCCLSEDQFLAGLQEVHRIAKHEGIVIFSFLNWDSRRYNSLLSVLVNLFRWMRHENVSKYYLPYLKLNKHLNFRFLNDNQASVFWVRKERILATLMDVGFSIIETTIDDKSTAMYIVCKKAGRRYQLRRESKNAGVEQVPA